ncbi:unnamed protein product [Somion occarium]|uniref:CID domain-containing protein n=1 Tax=Somion occarium TaxID=3059160 RepID=A0ABP1DVT0_9APHY
MDPFEVRMQFLTLLKRLNASQQSIQKVVGYALKYFSSCGDDLWDCIIEECQKGSINNRINILYFLDSLCEISLLAKSRPQSSKQDRNAHSCYYVDYVSRDLNKIIEYVVPEGRQGLPNLMSTKQILESWRSKRVVDPQKTQDKTFFPATKFSSVSKKTGNDTSDFENVVGSSLSRIIFHPTKHRSWRHSCL